MKKKKIIIMCLVALIFPVYAEKLNVVPMEQLNIVAGFGYDIVKELNGNVQYSIPFSIYDFSKREKKGAKSTDEKEEITEQGSSNIKAKASSIGETREQRQLNSSKPIIIGTEKIAIISEEAANYGIKDIINILFANAKTNDSDFFSVCKGKAEDILRFKVEGYPSSADYMEGIIRNSTDYNFLSINYSLWNIYVALDSEGENLVLPYLEIKDEKICITGMALFKGDKMAYVIPMEESKIMNMIREKKGKGILSLQEGPDKYINYDAMVKRKVKCNKTEGKYEFIIELDFKGDIINNTLYKDMKKENESEFEQLMEKKIENMCYGFLNKMKNVYKIDCLNLGMVAAAKYGRETGVDWNKEVSNADIKVNVKVEIDKMGIGQY
ncbi:Ger(x)C family spore germination protein [Clostridium tagluense]|uniref:Ger(x)C family spore germination protein n=1 Tax=Clostridium tagluense TaxID=360422 RepID=UPI001C0D3D84|nr:Ger(x)C family spore germination protein [Clostridium tagluense]MBU3129252.1 Ger(x)C family spore germination protein [Clostridium tagluense]MCB2310259.1 Ger(x)C family spore germination protein [Clostridium tagluense]MCB2315099.1 Ger(x)C family spore germination protein [Clostridium tagluense]MCB2319959.1 Ger(x)C family spore germination protein [Clostridium tagluense]MCB2324842.1 Ger(x)C family spore germination protein [Clostridium tagluense]